MYVVGIDENGLGPRLGPLTTTAVTLRLPGDYAAKNLRNRGLRLGLTDSKASAGTGRMRFAESVALALVERSSGRAPEWASELLAALHLDGAIGLVAPCPDAATRALCHGQDRALPAFGGTVAEGRDALAPLLRGRGALEVVRVRTVLSCVGVLNAAHAAGRNKLVVDLGAMERLAQDAARSAGEDLLALCGMVGGIRDVPRFASHFAPEAFEALETSRGRLRYKLGGVGELRFEVDSDAEHLPVALASMVGKYLRELAMARIVDFHRTHDATLDTPSGYHDPVTARFVAASAPIRARLAIAAQCFERRA